MTPPDLPTAPFFCFRVINDVMWFHHKKLGHDWRSFSSVELSRIGRSESRLSPSQIIPMNRLVSIETPPVTWNLKFNGSTCFETFLVQFDNCAKFNNWDTKDKFQYFALVADGERCTNTLGNRRYDLQAVSNKTAFSFWQPRHGRKALSGNSVPQTQD